MLPHPIDGPIDTDAARVGHGVAVVSETDDGRPAAGQLFGQRHADAAEALDRHPGAVECHVLSTGHGENAAQSAARGGAAAATRPPDRQRLAGDRRGDRVATVHRQRVHDPGHGL